MVVIRAKKVKAVIEEKTRGEILSLEKAGEVHRHARKEQKLRKVQKVKEVSKPESEARSDRWKDETSGRRNEFLLPGFMSAYCSETLSGERCLY